MKHKGTYKLVARDASSVVVRFRSSLSGLEELQHIHFEGDYYWIAVSENLIEWFKRVK